MRIILWMFKWFQPTLRNFLIEIEKNIIIKDFEYKEKQKDLKHKKEINELNNLVQIKINFYNKSLEELEKQRELCLNTEEMFSFKNIKFNQAADILSKVSNHMKILHVTSYELDELLHAINSSNDKQKIIDRAFNENTTNHIVNKLLIN